MGGVVTGLLQLTTRHHNRLEAGQAPVGSSRCGMAKLSTIELVMETQIIAAWFDTSQPKLPIVKSNNWKTGLGTQRGEKRINILPSTSHPARESKPLTSSFHLC